jgi:hypothetical protein
MRNPTPWFGILSNIGATSIPSGLLFTRTSTSRLTDTALRIQIVFDAIASSLRVTTQSQLLKTNEETTVYQSRRSYPVQACDDHEGNGATDV